MKTAYQNLERLLYPCTMITMIGIIPPHRSPTLKKHASLALTHLSTEINDLAQRQQIGAWGKEELYKGNFGGVSATKREKKPDF